MALLAIAINKRLQQELTVDVIEVELETELLTYKTLKSLSKEIFGGVHKLDINIEEQGKRAAIINTLASREKEELQVYLFHSQIIEIHSRSKT